MFVGPLLAAVVLPYMGVVVPLNQMFSARTCDDHKKMRRWASFVICTLFLVVPVAWVVPVSAFYRYDLLCTMMYALSAADAGASELLITRYLNGGTRG